MPTMKHRPSGRGGEILAALRAAEARLYDAATPEAERRDLSMEVAVLRARFARARRIGLWTADAALAMPEEE